MGRELQKFSDGYTEKKDLIDSIKWEYWIFFNWIN